MWMVVIDIAIMTMNVRHKCIVILSCTSIREV